MSRTVAAALAFLVMGSSLWADVIPTRRADGGAGDARKAVAGRLQELGLQAPEAVAQAGVLLDREARYFASDPARIQVAGRDEERGVGRGEKVLLGTLYFLAGVAALSVPLLIND
jgi:hypothetical protein